MHFERLNPNHNVTKFNCGETYINDFLKSQALNWQSKNLTSCTVLVDNENSIIGFYTLSFSTVHKKYFTEDVIPIRDVSVVLLGMFGVDKKYRGQDIGGLLLIDAIKSVNSLTPKFGFKALALDALNEKSMAYFLSKGFVRLGQTRKMVLSIENIKAILKRGRLI